MKTMKRTILILLTALLSTASLLAQYSPCYEAAFAEGKRLYNAGKYTQAKKYFNEAKGCPDPNTAAANEWIGKCNQRINDKEIDAARFAYMRIKKMDFCNVELNGQIIDDYSTTFNMSRLKYIQPRITYDGMLNVEKKAVIYVKVFDPNKTLVTGVDWPSGHTYSDSVRIVPGKMKNLMLSKWNNNGLEFSFGTYRFELWVNGNCIHSSSFEVEADKMFVISQFDEEYNSYFQRRIEGAYYYLQSRYDSDLRQDYMSYCKLVLNEIKGKELAGQYDTVEKKNADYVFKQVGYLQKVLYDQAIIKDNYDRIVRNLQDYGCLPDSNSLSRAKEMVDIMTGYVKNSYHPNIYKKYDEAIALINMELRKPVPDSHLNNPDRFDFFIKQLKDMF